MTITSITGLIAFLAGAILENRANTKKFYEMEQAIEGLNNEIWEIIKLNKQKDLEIEALEYRLKQKAKKVFKKVVKKAVIKPKKVTKKVNKK